MKTRLFISILATAMFASCEKEISIISNTPDLIVEKVLDEIDTEEIVEFKCIMENDATTRTSMTSTPDAFNRYSLFWQKSDAISIFDGTNTAVFRTDEGDAANATFYKVSGLLEEGATTYTAFYPSTITKDNQVLPSVQLYEEGNVKSFPMYAVSNDHELHFKNLCGIFKVSLKVEDNNNLKVSKISLYDDYLGMSGHFTINENDAAVVTGTSGVTLYCGEGITLASDHTVEFNVVVPVGNYTSLKVKITDDSGRETTLAATDPVSIERSGIAISEKTLSEASFETSLEYITVTNADVNLTYL